MISNKEQLFSHALEKLHNITANDLIGTDQRIQKLLQLGSEAFNLPFGLVSKIYDDTYLVEHALSPNNEVSANQRFELGNTYCTHTLQADEPTAFSHVAQSSIKDHPCYSAFKLESYIGAPLIVEGKRYGTINFSSPTKRSDVFSPHELDLIRIFSRWIGNELTRNKIELRLSQQRKMLEIMSSQARIGAWEINLKTNHLYWSKMTKEIHEVPLEYVPDLTTAISFYKPGFSQDKITEKIELAMTNGESWYEELQIVTLTGRECWVAAIGEPVFENNQCVGIYGSFQDIDEKVKNKLALTRAKEHAEAAAFAKNQFLANMSHEIRTPMNGILGMLQWFKETPLNEQQSYNLQIARTSADGLLTLLNDILDLSKIEAGKVELEKVYFNLSTLINEFAAIMQPSFAEKKVELIIKPPANLKNIVNSDPVRLRQILHNLVGNALKFTAQGKVTLRWEIAIQNSQSLFLCQVEDTGIGICSDALTHLFQPFSQADTTTTRNFGGTGLGLSIVHQFCQLMGGEISVNSEVNQGSCFSLRIPMKLSDNKQCATSTFMADLLPIPTIPLQDLSQASIMVVEDNDINQIVILELLKQIGLSAQICENGKIAIDTLLNTSNDQPIDLILMDCQMPVMDGFEATQRIRQGQAGKKFIDIPIIALTANAMKGDKEHCLEIGMTDYISKPVDRVNLESTLRKYIQVNLDSQ